MYIHLEKARNGELGNGENFNYSKAQLVGKNEIQTNTGGITIEEGKTFNIDAYITYFNLFEDKTSEIRFEIIDEDLAMVNSETGEILALRQGRTTVIAKEIGTDKIAVVPVRILENSRM